MKRKELPSISVPDPKHTSKLMSRLQTFLPQLQAANQALPAEPVAQVDVDLAERQDDSDNDDSSTDSSNNKVQSTESNQSDKQMIQINFALTEENNPMVDMLTSKQEDDGGGVCEGNENGISTIDKSKERAVTKLLFADDDDDDDDKRKQNAEKKKKPSITELC